MKTKILCLNMLAVAVALATITPSYALDLSGKTYISGDVGASYLQDVAIKNADGHKASFNIGIRTDLSLGCHFNDQWAAELETGLIWNNIRKIGVEQPPPPPPTPTPSNPYLNGKGDVYQIPLLANVIYTVPTKGSFKPYAGVGAGGVATILDATFTSSVHDTDFTFAYQAFGGMRYILSDRVDVGLAYKFLGTFDHDWQGRTLAVHSKELYTHSVLAVLRIKL